MCSLFSHYAKKEIPDGIEDFCIMWGYLFFPFPKMSEWVPIWVQIFCMICKDLKNFFDERSE